MNISLSISNKLILGLVVFLISSTQAFSQYNLPQNNVWAFGYRFGMDFNGSNPPSVINTAINVHTDTFSIFGEANASVCDEEGNLLFYTNGSRVWDRANNLMPGNLNCLHGLGDTADRLTTSTSNGAVIVPIPGRTDRYYLFSLTGLGPFTRPNDCRLYYSVIDMDLNNAYGDIVPGKKWILLDSMLTEKMVAIQGTCGRIWLVTHVRDTTAFKAYEISSTGLNPHPIISYAGTFYNLPANIEGHYLNMTYLIGQMTASPDGKRIAAAYSNGGMAAVYDFDPASGMVSNELMLDNVSNSWYGTAFSPNSKMVYFDNFGSADSIHSMIYQFNLGLSSNQAIRNSKYKVGINLNSQLRLGPDDQIYFRTNIIGIGQIINPNNPGAGCNYTAPNIIGIVNPNYPNFAQGFLGLGSAIIKVDLPPSGINRVHIDSISCLDTNYTLSAPNNHADSYLWDDESEGRLRTIHQAGTYWVRTVHDCVLDLDTFKVYYYDENDLQFDLGKDTIVCNTGSLLLVAPGVADATYRWQDSSREKQYLVQESGEYTLQLQKGNCITSDSIKVTLVNVQPNLGNDSIFCLKTPIYLNLKINAEPGASILWNNGSTANHLVVNDSGTFYVTLSKMGCTGSDTLNIGKRLCDCRIYFPNSFSPNHDGRNDLFRPNMDACPLKEYRMVIYNRYGQKVFESVHPEVGWDGTFKGVPLSLGTYFYHVRYLATGSVSKARYAKGDITLIR